MRHLETHIELPPGLLSPGAVRELLRLGFEQYRWFVPMRYGTGSLREKLDPDRLDLDEPLSFYEREKRLCIGARTDQDYLWLSSSRPDAPPSVGRLILATRPQPAKKANWRAAHIEQVTELMRLLRSPLAFSGLHEDIERKTQRLVPEEIGQRLDFTVRNHSEGLAGLFWRNFFGPPFVRLFGERLASLPEDCRTSLGEELVLVQPYALPSDAGTQQGEARERALIAHLGPECFYNHEHHTPPTRLPVLGPYH